MHVGDLVILVLVREQLGMRPHRLAVLAPIKVQGPARQLLTRIPLALSVVQQASVTVLDAQLVHQIGTQQTLGRAHGLGVPLVAIAVVDRHESRLAALRQAHVVLAQVLVDTVTQRLDAGPLLIGVRQRDARGLPHARDAHVMLELGLAFVDGATDRRRRRRIGRTGQRDVTLAGQQAGGRIEADPACAGQKDLAPGVQVGEVDLGATRSVQRLHVALELNQVARDKASREAQMPKNLHQQPSGVTTRPRAVGQRHLRRLHAGLHADEVADVLLQLLVQFDQEVVGVLLRARHAVDVLLEQRRQFALSHVRGQLGRQFGLVLEGKILGRRLQEEVERVQHRHLGDQIDLDAERRGLVGEHQPRKIVGLRVLLPVDEVGGGLDAHRIAQDARA